MTAHQDLPDQQAEDASRSWRPGRAWRRLPGVRVLDRLGARRTLSIIALLATVQGVVVALFLWRPDLLSPSDIGTDPSNYYAAALRLLDGHAVYALAPGDRPVPVDNPPYWSVPLLSPPTMAVMWLPLGLLPAAVAMLAWWAAGLVGTVVVGIAAAVRRSPAHVLGAAALTPALAVTAVSGNVNALLIPGLAAAFWLLERPRTRRADMALALLAGLMTAAKLGPVLLIWWLLVRGRTRAAALAVAVAVAVGVAAISADPGSLAGYLEISRVTAVGGATTLSVTSLLRVLGAPDGIAVMAPLLAVAVSGAAALLLRNRPGTGAVVVALGLVLATPVVRFESFAVVVAAFAVQGPSWLAGFSWPAIPRAAVAAGSVVTAFALLLVAGSAPQSGVTVSNAGGRDILVRIGAAQQPATFGFRVPAGSRARAFGPLTGEITGPIHVFDVDCVMLASFDAPSGGHLSITSDGSVVLDPALEAESTSLAPYDSACASP